MAVFLGLSRSAPDRARRFMYGVVAWLPLAVAAAAPPSQHPTLHGAAPVPARPHPGVVRPTTGHPAVIHPAVARQAVVHQAVVRPTVARPAVMRTAVVPLHQWARKPDPEQLLIEVYKDLGANQLQAAQAKADALVLAYPNFRLGQLIRGDLLMMHTHKISALGGGNDANSEALANLRAEAMVRLKSLRERPDPTLMPKAILQLRADQKYALIVDARRSRLYVYENAGGTLKFLTDYYVSQGKLGVNKLREGDQKTPVGVYYITSRLGGAKLPNFYGAGALPINYPNDWDRVNGRSGSGIWLHGTPPDSYSRPPLSSDGCVVLTNQDLNKLFASIEIGKTPVVISENVKFISRAEWEDDRSDATRLLESWRLDAESADPARIGAHYSPGFRSELGEDLTAWLTRHHEFLSGGSGINYRLRDVTSFFYPGNVKMMVITFTQESIGLKSRVPLHPVRKRQYWAREGSRWKIVSETML